MTRKRRFVERLRRRADASPPPACTWDAAQILACQRHLATASDEESRVVTRTLSRLLSALFTNHGQAWGARQLIVQLTTDLCCNTLASDAIGSAIEPLLAQAALTEGFRLLPSQERPVVINTKGASASGKSSLRPLQKHLAHDIGVRWSDFALISPDIWRKQLLDYGSLGSAYKYAGAFTGEELHIIDRKLDRYMESKHACGRMSHLLIDRFRFDSFAPDSDEAGSNFLTRFGHAAFLFFVITPPEALIERAWKRGLEFGRFKAVDDTLAHAVDAYSGIPNVFFTWVRRSDKRIQFEFLDNTVALGDRPRTVAFGDNHTINIFDVPRMLDIDRHARVNVDARSAPMLHPDLALLAPEHNLAFLSRCVREFRRVLFAERASGRVYLTIESGRPLAVDRDVLLRALRDPDTRAGVNAVVPAALDAQVPALAQAAYLRRHDCAAGGASAATLGAWGES